MKYLIPVEELLASQERYEAKQAAERARKFAEMQTAHGPFVYRARTPEEWEARTHRDPVKAKILLEVCAEFPDATAKELAEASGMSMSWVRRTLKKAGLRAAKPARQKQVKP